MKAIEHATRIITERDGFHFGEPWRPSGESVAAVVPIIRQNGHKRGYKTFSEAGKTIVITDLGGISPVQVKNTGSLPVLLRSGEILAGDTQQRTFTTTQFIAPKATERVEVVCVHQSRGISPGATFNYGKVDTPYAVASAMSMSSGLGRGSSLQSTTWAAATDFVSASPVSDSLAADTPRDDLHQAQATYQERLKGLLEEMPRQKGQVGAAVIGLNGAESLECFDHATSWKALAEAVLGRSSEIAKEMEDSDQVFEYRPERAPQMLRQLLVDSWEENVLWEGELGKTVALIGKKHTGEVTILGEKIAHLLLLKK